MASLASASAAKALRQLVPELFSDHAKLANHRDRITSNLGFHINLDSEISRQSSFVNLDPMHAVDSWILGGVGEPCSGADKVKRCHDLLSKIPIKATAKP